MLHRLLPGTLLVLLVSPAIAAEPAGPVATASGTAAVADPLHDAGNGRFEDRLRNPLPTDIQAPIELFSRGDFSIRMGALLQLQSAFYVGNSAAREFGDAADTEGFRIRRARIGFSGGLIKDVSYDIGMDLKDAAMGATGDRGSEILDARIRWARWSFLAVHAGMTTTPFSSFSIISSSRLDLIERPFGVEMLSPGRRVGVILLGYVGSLQYGAGLYNASDGVTTGNRFAGLAAGAHLRYDFVAPVKQFAPRRFQSGIAGSYMYDDQSSVKLHRACGSLDVGWHGARLQSEFLWEHSDPKTDPEGTPDAGPLTRWASVTEGSVFVFRDILQIAARYEYVRDNVALATFGKQQLITAGATWYIAQNRLKLQANYIRRDELGDTPGIPNDIALARLQAMF